MHDPGSILGMQVKEESSADKCIDGMQTGTRQTPRDLRNASERKVTIS
jgi:hypothetical protein